MMAVALAAAAAGAAGCGDSGAGADDAAVDAALPDAAPDAGPQPQPLELGALHDVVADASGVAEITLATPGGDEVFLVLVQSRARAVSRRRGWSIHVTDSAASTRRRARHGGVSSRAAFTARAVLRWPAETTTPWKTAFAAAGAAAGGPARAPARKAPRGPARAMARTPGRAAARTPVQGPARTPAVMVTCGLDHEALADLRARLAGQPAPRGRLHPPPLPAPLPDPGDTVAFEVGTPGGVETVDASVLLVSDALVICLDRTTDPALTLDGSDLEDIALGFEQVVLPRLRVFFGPESDVNADGRITVLFSPLVAQTGTAFVNPYDLVTDPALRPAGVAANDQELLYVTPPQMLDPHAGTPRAILETLAHEFQHAIYFHRKYLLNHQLDGVESVYITEGLSGLAQDLSGYHAGIFFINMTALNRWDLMSFNDLVLSGGGYFSSRPELYGGAYLLLRYLYDQAGGDALLPDGSVDPQQSPAVAWLRELVDSALLGETSLEHAAGTDVISLATDWYTALMVDDRVDERGAPLNTDPRYNYLPTTIDPITGRQRGTSMFERFGGMVEKTGPVVYDLAEVNDAIRVGGAEYVRVEATGAAALTLQIQADPVEVDPFLRIFRVR
jgi:hypothetical protein